MGIFAPSPASSSHKPGRTYTATLLKGSFTISRGKFIHASQILFIRAQLIAPYNVYIFKSKIRPKIKNIQTVPSDTIEPCKDGRKEKVICP